jgi:hypothetical protein
MHTRLQRGFVAGAIAAGVTALLIANFASSQAQVSQARRTADGKADLNGIWQTLNTANWDLQQHAAQPGQVVALGAIGAVPAGLGVVEGNDIPYLPDGRPGSEVLFAGRAARDLHALSISDRSDPERHPDGL